jgi:hypothetical protein
MPKDSILILEDDEKRIADFRNAITKLGADFQVKIWRDASTMISELPVFVGEARLFSLDHDLNPMPGTSIDPGTGLDVVTFLCKIQPVCPVILHSSNYERVWSMHNELRFSGWDIERVGGLEKIGFGIRGFQ